MPDAVGAIALRFATALGERTEIAGIPVVFLSVRGAAPAAFARMAAAVELVALHDARRFRTVTRLRRIVIGGHVDGPPAFYSRAGRACIFALSYVDATAVSLAWLASALVHEATHARIHDLGVPFAEARRARTERLCIAEQLAFLQRLPDAATEAAHAKHCLDALGASAA